MFFRISLLFCFASFFPAAAAARDHVILLHGLCRTTRSMQSMEQHLQQAGYHVLNVGYPSRQGSVVELSDDVIGKALSQSKKQGARRVHFVTHSMGGILVRSYLKRHKIPTLGKVIMLAPPNQGSEVVSRLGHLHLFQYIHGPAGGELGTEATATPKQLGTVNFPLGIIAGNRSINWINSLMIKGRDDGKVSIKHTKVQGMDDHIVVKTSHPYIMKNKTVQKQTLEFLRSGRFNPDL